MGVKHFTALLKAMAITDFSADGIFFMPNVQLFKTFPVSWPKSIQTLGLRKMEQNYIVQLYCIGMIWMVLLWMRHPRSFPLACFGEATVVYKEL